MAVYFLKAVQRVPISVKDAWHFFSSPGNLHLISDSEMGFTVLSHGHSNSIYAGQVLEYRVRPILGIPLYWMTEITHVREGLFFVDEQRFGPFRMWHHQHHFREIDGGVEMTDLVHYKNPLGKIGDLANALFVRKKVQEIFRFRYQRVIELLGDWPGQEMDISLR